MEKTLEHLIELEQLTSAISRLFLSASIDQTDEKIEESLGKIGVFFKVDRMQLFQFEDIGKTLISCTHQWCANGIHPNIKEMQKYPADIEPLWINHIKTKEPIYIHSKDELPDENILMRKLMETHGVISILIIPLIHQDDIIGVIAFESIQEKREWKSGEIASIQNIPEIFVYVLTRGYAEYKRQKAEIMYHNIFHNMLNGYMYCKMLTNEKNEAIDFRIIDINPAFTTITGRQRSEIVNKRILDFEKEGLDNLYFWIKKLEDVALYGKNITFEGKANGKWFKINCFSPKEKYFIVIFSDISEKKMAEDSLRKSEKIYRVLVENSSDFIFQVGLDGKIVFANKYIETLGYTLDDALKLNVFDLLHPDSTKLIEDAWKKMMNHEDVHTKAAKIYDKAGKIVEVEVKANLLIDNNNNPLSFLCIARRIK